MSTSMNQIYNKVAEDKDVTLDILGAIIECINFYEKLFITSSNRLINFNIAAYPDDVVYFNHNHLFIPEKILEDRICSDTYLDIEDIVNILKNTRIKHKRILSDNFYVELNVSTPVGYNKVDTLCFDYRPVAWVIGCLGKELDK